MPAHNVFSPGSGVPPPVKSCLHTVDEKLFLLPSCLLHQSAGEIKRTAAYKTPVERPNRGLTHPNIRTLRRTTTKEVHPSIQP